MFALDIVNFIKGYVSIRIDGFFCERFINLCVKKGILLWDIKRSGESRIYAKISISDFKRVNEAAKKTRSKVTIAKKSGLPFLMFRYRKRRLALIGIVIFFVMLTFFKSHVMGIDIRGNERIETDAVEAALKDFGVYLGADLRDIDRRLVQNKMMNRMEDIAWIGVNIRGSRVYIEIKERLDTEENPETDIPCDLIAKRDGIIEELDVREGQSMVKRNEFVEEGDLLVSGAMDSNSMGIRYVHSYGEIYASTNYEKTGEYALTITEKKLTGRQKKKYSIHFGEKSFDLFLKNEPDYKYFEKKEDVKKTGFWGMEFKTCTYSEYEPKKIKRGEKEAFEDAKKDLIEKMKQEIFTNSENSDDIQIKNISSKYEKKDAETIEITVNFELRENIALQRPIDKIENLNYDILNKDNNNL